MQMPVWLATGYHDSDEWYFIAAQTRASARLHAAVQFGDGASIGYRDARAVRVRPDGRRAGRGYRGPLATIERDREGELSEREVRGTLGLILCDRCDSYQTPLPDGRCQQCVEADEDDVCEEGDDRG